MSVMRRSPDFGPTAYCPARMSRKTIAPASYGVGLCLFMPNRRYVPCQVPARRGTILLMIASLIADQDLGEPVDLLYNAVDLLVHLATGQDVGQRSREEMAGRPQELQRHRIFTEPSSNLCILYL